MAKKTFGSEIASIVSQHGSESAGTVEYIKNNLEVLEELKTFIHPLERQSYEQLEANIKRDGCRDPLTVWVYNGKYVLLDGHHRYKICREHGIEFGVTVKRDLDSVEAARAWMIENQIGRRNMTPKDIKHFSGLMYDYKTRLMQDPHLKMETAHDIAGRFGVSPRTVQRNGLFYKGLKEIQLVDPKNGPKFSELVLAGKIHPIVADLELIGRTGALSIQGRTFEKAGDVSAAAEAIRERKREAANKYGRPIPIGSKLVPLELEPEPQYGFSANLAAPAPTSNVRVQEAEPTALADVSDRDLKMLTFQNKANRLLADSFIHEDTLMMRGVIGVIEQAIGFLNEERGLS